MAQDLIKGIVYSQFDDKAGPTARVWIPSNLTEKIQDLISLKTINVLAGEGGKVPESLGVIPFPSIKQKGLVKYMEIRDHDRRGKGTDCSLTLLFDEADDLIFYKYIKNFEKIFAKVAKKLKKLEEKKVDKDLILSEIDQFQGSIRHVIEDLRKEEVSTKEGAFPEAAEKGVAGHDFEWKLIVVGDPHVGKTSTILRFTDSAFRRTYIPTMGVNLSKKQIKYKNINVKYILWDIAGQSKFQSMRKPFYTGSAGVLLVFDLTDPDSFHNVPHWYKDITGHLKRDLDGFILANKNDLVKERKVKGEDIQKMAEKLHLGYYETSAKTGEHIADVFQQMAELIYNKILKKK